MSDSRSSTTRSNSLLHIFGVSDGTGETVENIVKAMLKQFDETNVKITRYKNIRTQDQAEAILEEAQRKKAVLVYTVVTPDARKVLGQGMQKYQIRSVDVFGQILEVFTSHIGKPARAEPGLLHQVNEQYFKRIEAMEFTVKHDDGANVENLSRADVVLVGVSRTSKTPLSIYLSHRGLKVANVPLVKGIEPPAGLFAVDQGKIVALTIDPEHLARIRRERLVRMGRDPTGDYASISHIREEIEWARGIFARNRRWPVFDVTNKALEETAGEVEKIIQSKSRLNS